jgi:sulfite reductase (NADPH) hemoprotein beta-component
MSSRQLRKIAQLSRDYDKGYVHISTRQNIQFNWPQLRDVPAILQALADVDMHAIQTSGNTIRNITADHFAGAAADEIEDPRPTAELLRQWSTDHPEFQYLPRKFKIAISGSPSDRAVTRMHDIGLRMLRNDAGEVGYEVAVGGGLGRTPVVGKVLRGFLPAAELLPYVEAIVSVWNQLGRRDNKYKARIKITVQALGVERFRALVEARFALLRLGYDGADQARLAAIRTQFSAPPEVLRSLHACNAALREDSAFAAWCAQNLSAHRYAQYAIVSVSLKQQGATPGDASAAQMRVLADLAEQYGHSELRISHEQNVILPHVHRADLYAVYRALAQADLATANIGLLSDIIACPGMDYCSLAQARSIPIAQQIALHFQALRLEHAIGPLKIKISGCINACGHHHVGHIGILGLDRAGVGNYQITLGGDGSEDAVIGDKTGSGFAADALIPALERLLRAYLDLRHAQDESFLACYRRLGMAPFRAALYPQAERAA